MGMFSKGPHRDSTPLDESLTAILLGDGRWYRMTDPMLNMDNLTGSYYVSFLQGGDVEGDEVVMVQVPIEEVKAMASHGVPVSAEMQDWTAEHQERMERTQANLAAVTTLPKAPDVTD